MSETIRRIVARIKATIEQAPGNIDRAGLYRMIDAAVQDELAYDWAARPSEDRRDMWVVVHVATGVPITQRRGRSPRLYPVYFKTEATAVARADKLNSNDR